MNKYIVDNQVYNVEPEYEELFSQEYPNAQKLEEKEDQAKSTVMGAFYDSKLPSSIKTGMTIVNVLKALPQIATVAHERKQLGQLMKNRIDNVPETLQSAILSSQAVAKDLFGSYNWAGSKRQEILDASIKYKQLQFDPLDEQLIAFNSKIDEFTAFMKAMTIDEDNADKLQKIMIGITKVLQTRQTLIDAIERRGERQKIAGDKGLSFLEEKKENKVII